MLPARTVLLSHHLGGAQARSPMPVAPDIRIYDEGQEWATQAADFVIQTGTQAVGQHGRFLIALSGGSTPLHLYHTLASPSFAHRFDWSRTAFYFGDERCVPPTHPDSNFGAADRALFTPLRIPPTQIVRMKGEASDRHAAARDYEQHLRSASHQFGTAWPRLDLILLGLGDDGHTASLFPNTPELHDYDHLVTMTHSPKGVPIRLTLTLGVINRASVIVFLVTGANKARIVRTVLEPKTDADRSLPAALVTPQEGRLLWLLDRPAAGELAISRQ